MVVKVTQGFMMMSKFTSKSFRPVLLLYDADWKLLHSLGVRHALETTDCEGVTMKVEPFELPTNANNPFFLPWSMRGMLEEPHVKDRLRGECMQLLEQFENWKPSSKVLKDVKFRLEGIRSKL